MGAYSEREAMGCDSHSIVNGSLDWHEDVHEAGKSGSHAVVEADKGCIQECGLKRWRIKCKTITEWVVL